MSTSIFNSLVAGLNGECLYHFGSDTTLIYEVGGTLGPFKTVLVNLDSVQKQGLDTFRHILRWAERKTFEGQDMPKSGDKVEVDAITYTVVDVDTDLDGEGVLLQLLRD